MNLIIFYKPTEFFCFFQRIWKWNWKTNLVLRILGIYEKIAVKKGQGKKAEGKNKEK